MPAAPDSHRRARARPSRMHRTSLRHANHAGGGAVIGNPALAAGAPVVVVGFEGHVQGLIVFVAIAQASPAFAFAAAVVVRHDVVVSVAWIVTGTDPGHRRRLGTRRAAVDRSSAAPAKE